MALVDVENLKTLVAIGDLSKKKKFICNATGFFVGFIAKNSKDPIKRRYWTFLVTNRHVFENKDYVYLRFNTKEGRVKVVKQILFFSNKESRWLAHKNKKVDVALLNINPQKLEQHSIKYKFINEELFAYHRDFKKIGIEVGDELFIIGFPMGIAGEIQNCPCVKSGIISRIDKELMNEDKAFLVDSSIFPGNSGSPVILKPTMISLRNTTPPNKAYLLGVISRYLPYEESLYTHQTNPPSIVSLERENSGLSYVVPMDFVSQIFKRWKKEKKKFEKMQKQNSLNQKGIQVST